MMYYFHGKFLAQITPPGGNIVQCLLQETTNLVNKTVAVNGERHYREKSTLIVCSVIFLEDCGFLYYVCSQPLRTVSKLGYLKMNGLCSLSSSYSNFEKIVNYKLQLQNFFLQDLNQNTILCLFEKENHLCYRI